MPPLSGLPRPVRGARLAIWLVPALTSLLLYGIGQGLVKQYIVEVPPARFCLYFVGAKAILNLAYWGVNRQASLYTEESAPFVAVCLVAYLLDGTAWLLYFQAIVHGPISIVGTLSAAYPALTVLFARVFLGEMLSAGQYAGITLVIAGCVGLSYAPSSGPGAPASRAWIPTSIVALLLWGASSTLLKAAYGLPGADEVNVLIYNLIGAFLTLGVYGLWCGRGSTGARAEWVRSFLPMGMLAGGDIGFILATRFGPVSLTTPLSGAYPLITVIYARIVLHELIGARQVLCVLAILGGMALLPGPG
jgi:drug/metabolite transporter (DMT)-like permease